MNAEHSKALRIDKFRKMETYLEEFFLTWLEGEDIPRSKLELAGLVREAIASWETEVEEGAIRETRACLSHTASNSIS